MNNKLKNLLNLIPFNIIYLALHLPFLKFKKINDIRPYFKQPEMRTYWRSYPNKENNKTKIIIYGLRMSAPYNIAVFEKVFSDCFRYNGTNVKNLICDNFLSSCDGATTGESDKVHCAGCRNQKQYFKKIYPNDFLYFSQFISKPEIESIKKLVAIKNTPALLNCNYSGVNVGRHASDSCIKYFRYGAFNPDNKRHLKVFQHNLFQGMLTVKIARNLLAKEKPTHLFTLHGCYSTWGPLSEYLSRNGVAVYIYRKSVNRIGCFDFTRFGEDTNDILAKDVWEQLKSKELGKRQQDILHNFLMKKKEGKTLDYKLYHLGKTRMYDETLVKILDSDNKPKFVLYSHLLWDKGFNTLGGIFKDDMEWMFETIKFFTEYKDALLFIKPHPGERSFFDWTEYGVAEFIQSRLGKLPENITVIPNYYPITSFELMDKGCIGIVFNSTAGLEHSYFKKPVLVAANVHYINAGAALKVCTKEEYFNLIKNPQPLYEFIEKNYDVIERYAYHYYFRQQIPIPFFRNDVWLSHCIDWKALSNYKHFIENDFIINHITKSIIGRKPVVNPN